MADHRDTSITVIWRFTDGKPGHDNQTAGLVQALDKRLAVQTYTLAPLSMGRALSCLLTGRFPANNRLKPPTLIIGAGHRTHLSILAARHAQGGHSIVLMRPTLPLGWFDLCLVPEHDQPPHRDNVLPTRGVLNPIPYSANHDHHQGLILIGGPSTHFGWDEGTLYRQLDTLLKSDRTKHWTLTTSRRTPSTFLAALPPLPTQVKVMPFAETTPDWLPKQLATVGQVWVTGDSVSMVYEALSSGAAVGILELPPKADSRVSRGLQELIAQQLVTPFRSWQRNQSLSRPSHRFNEAERCAHWIVERWLS